MLLKRDANRTMLKHDKNLTIHIHMELMVTYYPIYLINTTFYVLDIMGNYINVKSNLYSPKIAATRSNVRKSVL